METVNKNLVDLSTLSYMQVLELWRASQGSGPQGVADYTEAITSHNHQKSKILPRTEETRALYALADKLMNAGVPKAAASILAQEITALKSANHWS